MTTVPRFIAILITLLYSGYGQCQHTWIDSLKIVAFESAAQDSGKVNTLNQISDFYSFTEPDSAFLYAQQALSLAEQIKYETGKFWAIVYTNKALYVLGNYALELSFAFQAIPLAQALHDPHALGWSFGMLGDCYFNLGKYDTALFYYRMVKHLAERDSILDLFSIYSCLVPVFAHLHKPDSALYYARRGLTLQATNPLLNGSDAKGNAARCLVFRFMGEAFAANSNSDSALYYFERSLANGERNLLHINTIDVYNGIAAEYAKLKRPRQAILYAQKILNNDVLLKYPFGYLKAANNMTAAYGQLHIPDSTLKYLGIAYGVNDSLYNRDKTIAIQNVFFNQRQREKDIAHATEKLNDRYLLYFSLALMAVLIIIVIFVLRNKRLRELQVVRNDIADDLHDDIGSALSSISIMSDLAKRRAPEVSALLVSIEENTSAIQDNMGDIVWSIKSHNDRFENVLQRMQVFANEILDTKDIQVDFEVAEDIIGIQLNINQRKNFYLFFKEVINNAAKHSHASKITIVLSRVNKRMQMIVTDNGKGFDPSRLFNGNGMMTLRKRAAELSGTCNVESSNGRGCAVILQFKIT
jgi:two-component system sensor histidine kinase UhpB